MPARLTAYVAGSLALAAGVISYAAFERPNFYSAAVYLSQSNACLMILCNLALVVAGTFMYALQNFLYGPLRPNEVEQLWERGWFAVMEWIFAMSTFRDEFGMWFLVMFSSLFTGKIWGWIAEGRVEQLDQQDPGRVSLFHPKLVASLVIYLGFAVEMFLYSLDIVMYEARPGITVMFVFEFAILWICAISTCLRYGIWVYEHWIWKKQKIATIEARKAEIRQMHQAAATAAAAATANGETAPDAPALPNENEIDEDEIEVDGWESKKKWIFALDIFTDFFKLLAYLAFFTILTVFYGIPIYIIRDLYMTMRSFTKRITDYYKYQAATRDMHTRYPDATAEDLASDGVCIVCREDMKPWAGNIPAGGEVPPNTTTNERQRPKKLPCGHILHFSCLQSWMERQQACPICRRSVFAVPPTPAGQAAQNGQPAAIGAPNANPANPNVPPARAANRDGGRVFRFRFGPLRLQIGGGRVVNPQQQAQQQEREQVVNELFARLREQRNAAGANRAAAPASATVVNNPAHTAAQASDLTARAAALNAETIATHAAINEPVESMDPAVRSAVSHMQLDVLEAQIRQEIGSLSLANSRITGLRVVLEQLDRVRAQDRAQNAVPGLQQLQQVQQLRSGVFGPPTLPTRADAPQQNLGGVVVPPGWTLVPLNPVPVPTPAPAAEASTTADASTALVPTPTNPGPLASSFPTASSFNIGTPSSSTISSAIPSPSSSVRESSRPRTEHPLSEAVPEDVSTTAPLVPTPTWGFNPNAGVTDAANAATAGEGNSSGTGSVREGKRPVTDATVTVPETIVEPPTPDRESGRQPFVEEGEDEA
ncbi:hypothetical protein E6O75_ATG09442 [Venturia nashicola]|uniref:RING-type E3 ubiquitin transferase n=1 Tax=Venturia nashicola TaxID=86259 RepID=A0A4Z1NNS0_9PEZI|nr:hypothetical protein E6O75_ATG09442 [Venturia nashicola]